MKYYVYSFNYLTLFKSIIYAEKEWGVDNTFIIYTPYVALPPAGLIKKYNSYVVRHPKQGKRNDYYATLSNCKKIAREMLHYIEKNEQDRKSDISIVLFRDNMITETFLIKLTQQEFSNVTFILMEEGLGLYAEEKQIPGGFKLSIKKIINRFFGIPSFPLLGFPQGCNPNVDLIICSKPEALIGKRQDRGNNLVREMVLFTNENCQHFLLDVLNIDISEKAYDYVYLTQPLFPSGNRKQDEMYRAFLKTILEIMTHYGKVLIKPHPRDTWNYDEFASRAIDIAGLGTSKCPFECLMGYYGNPQTITLFSSAGCNIDTGKPNIFLYDMFPDLIRKDIFDEDFIKNNNIQRCSSMQEFEAALIKKQ